MIQNTNTKYSSDCGMLMQREYGETSVGNPLNGQWVLRSKEGEFIDFDQYRFDLMERNNIETY